MLVLVNQILTGVWLAMMYKFDAELPRSAQSSTLCAMGLGLADPLSALNRRVGIFIVIYLHMFRGLLYGSYRKPGTAVDYRCDYLHCHDGHCIHGLSASLGSDVLLGRAGDYQSVLGCTGGR